MFDYGRKMIWSVEIFDLLAWWYQQQKEFPHPADLVCFIYANVALCAAS
jgi:hypothetical protein